MEANHLVSAIRHRCRSKKSCQSLAKTGKEVYSSTMNTINDITGIVLEAVLGRMSMGFALSEQRN